MRKAKESDYKRKSLKRNYKHKVSLVDSQNKNGIPVIEISESGLFAVCGLNGAGKSTFIANLKSVMGLRLSQTEFDKCNANAYAIIGDKKYSSSQGKRFLDFYPNEAIYIDDSLTSAAQKWFADQTNLDELFDQYEQIIYDNEDIEEVNYLLGKHYDQISLKIIEDDEYSYNYFEVSSADSSYDSLTMGKGEYALFNIYQWLKSATANSVVIIEEPETFISTISQRCLVNIIRKHCTEKGISVIVTTHSPFIVEDLPPESIGVISRTKNDVTYEKACQNERMLISLGMRLPKKGILLVEDFFAKRFLTFIIEHSNYSYLINRFDVAIVNGDSFIDNFLISTLDTAEMKIVGVYDGDQKKRIQELAKKKEIKGNFTFLPHEKCADEIIKELVENNLPKFSSLIGISFNRVNDIISINQGVNAHDWFIDCARALSISADIFFEAAFNIWFANNEPLAQLLTKEIYEKYN